MVKFHFLPCAIMPRLNVICSFYELDAGIIYPPSYGDNRTAIQKSIDYHIGFKEHFPFINIGPLLLYVGEGNIVRSIVFDFLGVDRNIFDYKECSEKYPIMSLSLSELELHSDLPDNDRVVVKIDREKRVILINIGETKRIYETFSLADNLIVQVDREHNIIAMVFRNVQWVEMETEPSTPQQRDMTLRSLFSRMKKYIPKLR